MLLDHHMLKKDLTQWFSRVVYKRQCLLRNFRTTIKRRDISTLSHKCMYLITYFLLHGAESFLRS